MKPFSLCDFCKKPIPEGGTLEHARTLNKNGINEPAPCEIKNLVEKLEKEVKE